MLKAGMSGRWRWQVETPGGWRAGRFGLVWLGVLGWFGLVLLSPGPSGAEDLKVISLEDAVNAALTRSASVAQAMDRVASSRVSLSQAKADLYPDLSAGVSGSRQYSRVGGAGETAGDYEGTSSMSARLSSSLSIFDGFSTINSIRSSRLDLAATEDTYQRTRQAVIFATVSDYLAVLESGELLKSQQDNLDAERQRLALVEELHGAGNRSIADVLQERATVAQAELQVLSAQRDESVNKLQLTADMGLPPSADYAVGPVATPEDLPRPDSTRDAVLRAAKAMRPDLAAQRKQVDAASLGVAMARSGWWPSLSLSAGASSNYVPGEGEASFSQQMFEDNVGFQAGLSLSIPVFDRFRTSASVRQAKLSLSSEETALADLERTVTLEMERALLDYETALKRLEVAKAQMDYAGEALSATTARYQVGAATLVEVAASNAQYVSARNQLVQASYGVLLGRVAVSYYQGNIDEMARLLGLSPEGGSGG
jgi:outer membrane protein